MDSDRREGIGMQLGGWIGMEEDGLECKRMDWDGGGWIGMEEDGLECKRLNWDGGGWIRMEEARLK